MRTVEYLGKPVVQWRKGPSTFLAWPEGGARLMNWNVELGDGGFRDVLHWPQTDTLDRPETIRGGNPILFPFCARTFDGTEPGCWRWGRLGRRPMPRHGFARQGTFTIVDLEDWGFSARLRPTEQDREAYPFDYEFTVTYRFHDLRFEVQLRLDNAGREPLPWSAGHHFYFAVPAHEGFGRGDYLLHLPTGASWRQKADGTLERLESGLVERRLDDATLLDAVHTRLDAGVVELAPKDRRDRIAIRFGDGMRSPPPETAVVTWTENEQSPFYCVEPWMGPPNSPGTGVGLHTVAPGHAATFDIEVALLV